MLRLKAGCGWTGNKCQGIPLLNKLFSFNYKDIYAIAKDHVDNLDKKYTALYFNATLANNFGNIPRRLKGPVKLATILWKQTWIGLLPVDAGCVSLFNIFLNGTKDPEAVLDVYNKIINAALEDLDLKKDIPELWLTLLLYIDKNPFTIDPYTIDSVRWLTLLPGILVPMSQPSNTNNSMSSLVMPASINATNIYTGGKSDISKLLSKFDGCSGPGVLYRLGSGQLPTFVCLILCI